MTSEPTLPIRLDYCQTHEILNAMAELIKLRKRQCKRSELNVGFGAPLPEERMIEIRYLEELQDLLADHWTELLSLQD